MHWPVGEQIRSEQQSLGVRQELPSGEQQEPPTQSKSPQQSFGPVQAAPPGVAQQLRSEPQRVPGVQGVLPMQHICPRSPQSPMVLLSRVVLVSRVLLSRRMLESEVIVPPPGSQATRVSAKAKKAKRRRAMAEAYPMRPGPCEAGWVDRAAPLEGRSVMPEQMPFASLGGFWLSLWGRGLLRFGLGARLGAKGPQGEEGQDQDGQ